LRIINLRNKPETTTQKSAVTKSTSPNRRRNRDGNVAMPEGLAKRRGADINRNSDSHSNTVLGCPWLRMNIHKGIFSSIVAARLSRYAHGQEQLLRNIS
jgi:hypothetical protein